jgi:hypothetical protein
MVRISERFYTSGFNYILYRYINTLSKLDRYNGKKLDKLDIGETYIYPQNYSKQIKFDGRFIQKKLNTKIEWFKGPKKRTYKEFIIISIEEGFILGIPENWNGYLVELRRVS